MAKRLNLTQGAKDSLGVKSETDNRPIENNEKENNLELKTEVEPEPVSLPKIRSRQEKQVTINMQVPLSLQKKIDKILLKLTELRPNGVKAGNFHLRRSTLGRVALRLFLEKVDKIDLDNMDSEDELLRRLLEIK